MRKSQWIVVISFSLLFSPLHADLLASYREIWHCYAHDKTDKSFIALGSTEWSSLRTAMKLCKLESKTPKTCKVSREDCDALVNGVSVSPLWQCTALDTLGHAFEGGVYRVGDNAIYGAKNRCYSHSVVPATCYVYAFTCKNLNTN
jgi:hypothetical protein